LEEEINKRKQGQLKSDENEIEEEKKNNN